MKTCKMVNSIRIVLEIRLKKTSCYVRFFPGPLIINDEYGDKNKTIAY